MTLSKTIIRDIMSPIKNALRGGADLAPSF